MGRRCSVNDGALTVVQMPGPLLHVGATVMCTAPCRRRPPMAVCHWAVGHVGPEGHSNGVPLLLVDSQAICAPTGRPLMPLMPPLSQTRVTAQ